MSDRTYTEGEVLSMILKQSELVELFKSHCSIGLIADENGLSPAIVEQMIRHYMLNNQPILVDEDY